MSNTYVFIVSWILGAASATSVFGIRDRSSGTSALALVGIVVAFVLLAVAE
ncbi:hypothetical protein I5H85_gp058 [Mycobacterium phage Royals2015]|uniref:Uncharacterized protein n=2 Tax=Gracegardnervirinae TaxID=2946632 RepID=A0A6G6XKP3_9CAUD|nr:hypothetical protein HWD06_gp050 [Mycobacterium phage Cornie]YP_009961989.1 hypothetical protein I5H85_gp058 [Mycobacterium phage Royals2015]UVK63043.1 membrane protein [Mycobacterium phage Beakin]WAA20366.1 membrane protein [Mycobacterium phage VRedHorse]WNM65627.1 membrane protein [Mycobacterium phage Rialto]WNT44511.1 membrane protein [Mycobacterium phage BlueCrab]QIG58425.1 hypothetical protein SEA_CORNIE_50 [Mycobacterium phage Cornie]